MKRTIIMMLAALLPAAARAQFAELQTIEIGQLSTTHVVFASDLAYVDISKQDVIAAKVVDASKNMLAIKARAEFNYITTISALEVNGTMHTFKVKYNPYPSALLVDTRKGDAAAVTGTVNTQIRPDGASAGEGQGAASGAASVATGMNVAGNETSNFGRADAPTLEEIMRMPQELFHIGDRCYGLEAYVTNVYVYSDLLYVTVEVRNNSDIGYEAGEAQFTIENTRRKKQNLTTDKSLWAKSAYGTLSCAPRGTTTAGYTIPKFTLLENECMCIYIYEKKGTRNILLKLTDKDVNYAVSPRRGE